MFKTTTFKTTTLAAGVLGLFCVMLNSIAMTPGHAQRTPAPQSLDAQSLDVQALIDDAIKNKKTQVKLPAGTWRVPTPVLRIEGAHNFTFDGGGSTLIFSQFDRYAIGVNDSRDITLRNFAVDYDPLPFTQGTVTAIAPDKKQIEVELHAGYPDFAPPHVVKQAMVFEPTTRRFKANVSDLYFQIEVLSPRRARLEMNAGISMAGVETGDLLAFNVRRSGGVALTQSENVHLENVTLLSAPGLGFLGRFFKGENTFTSVQIKRGPRPQNATQERLLSISADGLNYAYARRGPVLKNADFAWMGDDSVNLHGVTLPVLKVEGNTLWTARAAGRESFGYIVQDGDALRFLDADSFAQTGSGVLARWEEAEAFEIPTEQARRLWPTRREGPLTFYKLTLRAPVTATVGSWFDLSAIEAANYTIRDSYFHDHRARGLRLMASNGEVFNNTFERQQGAAISIGPGYAFWRESGWPTNVLIRNNVVRDATRGLEASTPTTETPGAISIIYRNDSDFRGKPSTTAPRGTSNIRIENNWIAGYGRDAIATRGARDVTVRGNVFQLDAASRTPSTPRASNGINVAETDNLTATANRLENP